MIKPKKSVNEISRLAILYSLGILDTSKNEKLDRISRIAKRTFNVPIVLISLVDENRQWFKSCFGLDVEETSRDISFCGHAILGDGIFAINNALDDERFYDNPLVTGSPNIRFYAGCPIKIYGENIGTLCIIDTSPRIFSDDDKVALKDLALFVEDAINTMQESNIDFLTQVHNRKGFLELVKKAMSLCKREKIVSSLCFMDLNHFKAINDTYGHAEGDCVLKEFSKIIQEEARDSDVVGRLGGDEFVVWLIRSTKESAVQYIDRIKNKIKKSNEESKKPYKLDFAFGVIEIKSSENIELEDVIQKADIEMYNDKSRKSR